MRTSRRPLLPLLAAALAACAADAVPCASERCDSDITEFPNLGYFGWNFRDVDILFVIDNSPGGVAWLPLVQNIPRFIQKLDDMGANYHIGVATTDVGSYVAPGMPWSQSFGACDSFEGDDGTLQRVACHTRTGVSTLAAQACQSLCPDAKFVPAIGDGFISKITGVTNVPVEMVAGRDVGPQKAFQCIGLMGDAGCGVESPLESAKRALDGHNPLNNAFLRPGSVLAVIFLTDEDDCSVSLSRRAEGDPVSMDCPAPDKEAPGACFNPDFRCLARDVSCDQPLNTPGPKTGCHERESSYLEKIDNYVRFFSTIRPANKLLISGIWTLPRLDGGGKLIVRQRAGSTRSDELNRAEGADAGCVKASDVSFFGAPQIRLSKFARQFKDSLEFNVCDPDNYAQALDSIAGSIESRLEINCLPFLPKLSGGRPLCLIGDVPAEAPRAGPEMPFPVCGGGCCQAWGAASRPTRQDPDVRAACAAEPADCYCVLPSTADACRGGAVFGVWRQGGGDNPPSKIISARCAIERP